MATIKSALSAAYSKLLKQKIISAFLDAEVILAFVIEKPREFLFTHPEKKLTGRQLKKFGALINQRATKVPVAYLIGQKEFFGLNFFVNKNVLIPRPETELIVECATSAINRRETQDFASLRPKIIADIGTGSGCIGISIAKNMPNVHIMATDISRGALTVARKNAKQFGITKKIKFYHGNLLAPIKNEKIDIIVANLPYLPRETRTTRETGGRERINNLKHEPQIALYAGKDGLNMYKKLFEQISRLKHQPKIILIEIDPRQSLLIKKIILNVLPTAGVLIKKDLCGRNRVVQITI